MKFQLLIKTKMLKYKVFLLLSSHYTVFIMLINGKMPTIVGILTFMSRIFLCSVEFSMKKVYNLGACAITKSDQSSHFPHEEA